MTTTKDKLSASVRQAKAAQDPKAEGKTETESGKAGGQGPAEPGKPAQSSDGPAAKPRSGTRKTSAAPRKPAATKAKRGKPASADEVPESGTALFPDRVWPD
ncbi:MAG: hypothetical protein EA347_09170 [Thioalkalivibrio sp.]|nr:MAG: hypothetical protein EA347_09170 [Thioalkalivibrio sp.]